MMQPRIGLYESGECLCSKTSKINTQSCFVLSSERLGAIQIEKPRDLLRLKNLLSEKITSTNVLLGRAKIGKSGGWTILNRKIIGLEK